MKYEFFSTTRHPIEVACAFPMIRCMMSALDMRQAILHLHLYNSPTIQVMAKRYRGIRLQPPHPDFMRLGLVHEPSIEIDGCVYLNVWPHQARRVFGNDLTLKSIFEMCNFHLERMGLPPEKKIQKFFPHLPRKTLAGRIKIPRHDSLYSTVLVTPLAAAQLINKVQWSHLFSSCSLGFFAIPDLMSLNPPCVWRYPATDFDNIMLGELANYFDIVIATAAETIMFDIKNRSQVIYIIDDGQTYHTFKSEPFIRKSFCWENGHTFLVEKLREGKK